MFSDDQRLKHNWNLRVCVCEYFHVVVVQVTAQSAYLMFSKCKKNNNNPTKHRKWQNKLFLAAR